MQLGEAMLVNGAPECPKCQEGKKFRMHRHGSYSSKRRGGKHIERFCCPRCRFTCTLLGLGMVPYRGSSVKELQNHFDQRLGFKPVADSLCRGRPLQRALRDFRGQRERLSDVFGQMIRPVKATLQQMWCHLRKTIGSLEAILELLHGKFRTSLFKDYCCLKV
jgi:hypothetical protein